MASIAEAGGTVSRQSLFDEEAVLKAFEEHGIRAQHAYRMWRLIVQHGVTSLDQVPDMPKAAIALLNKKFALETSRVLSCTTSKDQSTSKLLLELGDGRQVETVIMRYGDVHLSSFPEKEKDRISKEGSSRQFKSNRRATVCVSSQVGCRMACTFCATGTMGLVRNLTAGEILEQLYHANKIEPIRNVVFMGMGEPLENYPAVIAAVRAMTDTRRWALAQHRISISTVGVVPRIYKLIEDAPAISLALSLHAPTQELRAQIVPTAKAYRLDKLLEAVDKFIDNQNANRTKQRHVMVEYVLLADVNDSPETARSLGLLLQGRSVLLNVIPYNPTAVATSYKVPSQETLTQFVDIVREYGVKTLIRQELGQDVSSACGQLVVESSCKATTNGSPDIEDLVANGKTRNLRASGRKSKKKDVPASPPRPAEGVFAGPVLGAATWERAAGWAIGGLLVLFGARMAYKMNRGS